MPDNLHDALFEIERLYKSENSAWVMAAEFKNELERLRAELSAEKQANTELQLSLGAKDYDLPEVRGELSAVKALLREASKTLIEVVRMPNQEHVADAHNETVRRIRAALGDEPADDAPRKQP